MGNNRRWIGLLLITLLTITGLIFTFAEIKSIPVRSTFEGIGFKVGWIQDEKAITLEKDLIFVKLYKDSPVAWINGNYEKLLLPIKVENGVSYTDESLLALLYDKGYTFSQGKVVLKPGAGPSSKYALPVVGTVEKLKELLPSFGESPYYRYDIMMDVAPAVAEESVQTSSDKGTDYSGTNVQVAGVDESDITKTDGRYIYTIRNGAINIVDTLGGHLVQVGQIADKETYYSAFYISGSKLVAMGTENHYTIQTDMKMDVQSFAPYFEQQTLVNIYDLTVIEKPMRIKAYRIKGSILSSRLIGNDFYMVVNQNTWYGGETYPTLQIDDQKPVEFGPERIHYFPDTRATGMMMTFALSLDKLGIDPDVAVYLNAGETLYMSQDNMYVAQTLYPSYLVKTDAQREQTALSKFTLDHGRMVFTATKAIEGRLISQWAMDEYQGNLRVAVNTSIGFIGDESTVSRIDIYSDTLEKLGQTEELAKGEKIYAVRFMEGMAYLVTFKQIDPFFAIDCSVPEKPVVLGYLKIPGYSQYLHPLTETKILGLGHQTKETEFGTRNDGLKFSIFDTADMENIKELDAMVVGNGSASSDSLYDHKAFMINLGERLFAIPVSLYSEYGTQTVPFVGAYIMKYTEDYQLTVLGTIQHKSADYDGMEPILRILYIGDTLYTVSSGRISAFQIIDLKPVDSVELK